ncbi:MAG: sterol carrier family protein [Tessaracoccus sp.]
MVKPTAALVDQLRALLDADGTAELERVLATRAPDLTDLLLRAVRNAERPLERTVLATACRGACARLRQRYPGATIELRVPPFAAAQIGFGTGPRHTRGTPPNVVEFSPEEFLDLVVGTSRLNATPRRASGVHADEAAAAFPLIA